MHTVYLHVNKINGKKYFGQTSQQVQQRWANGSTYKGSYKLYNAIRKYGWSNFNHFVIKTNLTADEANVLEMKLISAYSTTETGYNISKGGVAPMVGRKHTDESKNKIKKARLNQVFTTEDNLKRISTMLGYSFYGLVTIDSNQHEEYYSTVREACDAIGGTTSCINRCLRGERQTHKGYHFRLAQKNESMI